MDKCKGFIYRLIDPNTFQIRYIGQTICPLNQRLRKHISDSRRQSTHVACWIKGLIYKTQKPIIEEIENCEISLLDEKEVSYIEHFRNQGVDLTNISNGGQVNRHMAEETRKKISKSLTGRKPSLETLEKKRRTSLETWKSTELRALKREQTLRLYKLGFVGRKGQPSKTKGKPFVGDRELLSQSLKRYYQTHEIHNKTKIENIQELINDYINLKMPLPEVGKKYGIGRTTVTRIMKENNIPFRNDGSKKIQEEVLRRLVCDECLQEKQIAAVLKCSTANVQKFKKKYKLLPLKYGYGKFAK